MYINGNYTTSYDIKTDCNKISKIKNEIREILTRATRQVLSTYKNINEMEVNISLSTLNIKPNVSQSVSQWAAFSFIVKDNNCSEILQNIADTLKGKISKKISNEISKFSEIENFSLGFLRMTSYL